MKKFSIYLGMNDKETKVARYDLVTSYKLAEDEILRQATGYSIYLVDGAYKHSNGTLVKEKSLKIEIMYTSRDNVVEIAKNLKRVFNQEEVIIQEEVIKLESI